MAATCSPVPPKQICFASSAGNHGIPVPASAEPTGAQPGTVATGYLVDTYRLGTALCGCHCCCLCCCLCCGWDNPRHDSELFHYFLQVPRNANTFVCHSPGTWKQDSTSLSCFRLLVLVPARRQAMYKPHNNAQRYQPTCPAVVSLQHCAVLYLSAGLLQGYLGTCSTSKVASRSLTPPPARCAHTSSRLLSQPFLPVPILKFIFILPRSNPRRHRSLNPRP